MRVGFVCLISVPTLYTFLSLYTWYTGLPNTSARDAQYLLQRVHRQPGGQLLQHASVDEFSVVAANTRNGSLDSLASVQGSLGEYVSIASRSDEQSRRMQKVSLLLQSTDQRMPEDCTFTTHHLIRQKVPLLHLPRSRPNVCQVYTYSYSHSPPCFPPSPRLTYMARVTRCC